MGMETESFLPTTSAPTSQLHSPAHQIHSKPRASQSFSGITVTLFYTLSRKLSALPLHMQ